jgi:hypothetical protein
MVDRVKGGGRAPPTLTRVQIQKEEISDLKRENQFLVKSDLCKPVLKLNFKAHAMMESLSEFGLRLGGFYHHDGNVSQKVAIATLCVLCGL